LGRIGCQEFGSWNAENKKRLRAYAFEGRIVPNFMQHLLLINNFTPGPWWVQWSVLGWGIGLAFHFKAIYFSHGKRFENKIKLKHKRVGVS